jgi:spermidine synthase
MVGRLPFAVYIGSALERSKSVNITDSANRTYFSVWAVATIFVSAFLLFEVQPVISKMILPWFGGSPMVWSICLLFFQTLLLVGYAYVHILVKQRIPVQVVLHLLLLVVAIVLLPITPEGSWKPDPAVNPTFYILQLLSVHVGLPYVLLSSTAPLVQTWYSQVYSARSPYRLYAVSNFSSMLALLGYPFLIEPAFDSPTQGQYWSYAFLLFAAFVGGLGIQRWRLDRLYPSDSFDDGPGHEGASLQNEGHSMPPRWPQVTLWLFLPALASMMLMAVTNHVSQDIAAIPFLWIAPLCLYLLSFILCFDSTRWYHRGVVASLTAMSILAISVLHIGEVPLAEMFDLQMRLPQLGRHIPFDAGLYFGVLFLVCMLCHGELVRLKPDPRYLTSFYLAMSAGGAIGGVFVAIVCPLIFSTYLEIRLGLIAAYVVAILVMLLLLRARVSGKGRWLYVPILPLMIGALVVVLQGQIRSTSPDTIVTTRNFYGGLRISEAYREKPWLHMRVMYHGRILHGSQLLQPGWELIPTNYYAESSGVGVVMKHYPHEGPRHVGVIGLGTGSMAGHAREGDRYRFYEINPQVVAFAESHFSYLENTPAATEVILGDARLSMESEAPQEFDILVVDAFTGDAPPVHLLTGEAFDLYLQHLKTDGILAFHVSNRHLDLGRLVAATAESNDMKVIEIYTPETGEVLDIASTWIVVTDNQDFIQNAAVVAAAKFGRKSFEETRVWTDKYSNLFQLLDL